MKKLLLAMLCLPAFAYGQTYTYNKLVTKKIGTQNISSGSGYCMNVSGGTIELTQDSLFIDGKAYILKPKRADNMFKSKKCSFEMLYADGKLAGIRQFRYDDVTLFVIDNSSAISAR